MTKAPKYTYVRLSELKPAAVFNVYGAVVFFKQPYRTRGTGESSITITKDPPQLGRAGFLWKERWRNTCGLMREPASELSQVFCSYTHYASEANASRREAASCWHHLSFAATG